MFEITRVNYNFDFETSSTDCFLFLVRRNISGYRFAAGNKLCFKGQVRKKNSFISFKWSDLGVHSLTGQSLFFRPS